MNAAAVYSSTVYDMPDVQRRILQSDSENVTEVACQNTAARTKTSGDLQAIEPNKHQKHLANSASPLAHDVFESLLKLGKLSRKLCSLSDALSACDRLPSMLLYSKFQRAFLTRLISLIRSVAQHLSREKANTSVEFNQPTCRLS